MYMDIFYVEACSTQAHHPCPAIFAMYISQFNIFSYPIYNTRFTLYLIIVKDHENTSKRI